MDALEDIGFYCVDNIPPKLIPVFYTCLLYTSGLGGVAGMVLGVPILAVLYLLLSEFVNKRLQKKGTVVAAEGPAAARCV